MLVRLKLKMLIRKKATKSNSSAFNARKFQLFFFFFYYGGRRALKVEKQKKKKEGNKGKGQHQLEF